MKLPVEKDNLQSEIEVEAGIWISQFYFDGNQGHNVLCHTLRPNVTIDFAQNLGAEMGIRWSREMILRMPKWQVYVHDRNENASHHSKLCFVIASFLGLVGHIFI